MAGIFRTFFLAATAVIGSIALIFQFEQAASHSGLVNFFSSYTILANILAAFLITTTLIHGSDERRDVAASGVVVYLIVVAAIYFAEFHGKLEATRGIAVFTDLTVHYLMPLLFALYWIAFVPKGRLSWRAPLLWLAFPLLYLAYTLVRGALTGTYPYPFIDVSTLGYFKVGVTALVLLAVYAGLGLMIVAVDRIWGRLCPPIDLSAARA